MEIKNEKILFIDFISKWVHEISNRLVSAHLDPFLEKYDLPDLRLNALLHAYESNQSYKKSFIDWVITQRGKNAENINFDGCIRMVGIKTATKFLVLSLIGDRIPIKQLQCDPKTGLFLKPLEQILFFSFETQKHFSDGTRYHEIAFPLGFFFDYIKFYNELHNSQEYKKKTDQFIHNRYELAIKTAKIANEIVKQRDQMVLEKDVLPLIFLESAAQAAFAIFDPTYIEFISKVEKINLNSTLINYAEKIHFGGHHSRIASSSTLAIPQFSKLGNALLSLQSPSLLTESKDFDLSELVSIVFLAFYMAKNQNALSKISQPIPSSTLCDELINFDHIVHFENFKGKEAA